MGRHDTRMDPFFWFPAAYFSSMLLILSVLSSCGVHKVDLKPIEVVTQAPRWEAVRSTHSAPGCEPPKCELLMIVSSDNASTAEAVKQLCSKTYVCTAPEKVTETLYMERRRR